MKKIMIIAICTLTLLIAGCGKSTIVIDDNAKEQQLNENATAKKRVVKNSNEKTIFFPIYYNKDGVYGVLQSTELELGNTQDLRGIMEKPYLINRNGEFIKLDEKYFGEFAQNGSVNQGIYTEDYKTYYYKSLKNKVNIKLEGYEKLLDYKTEEISIADGAFEIGDEYFIDLKTYYYHGIYDEKEGKRNQKFKKSIITLVDIKNNKVYYSGDLDKLYISFYYDPVEKSLMAFESNGNVSKISIGNDKIELTPYKSVQMKGFNFTMNNYEDYSVINETGEIGDLISFSLTMNDSFVKGENIVLNFKNKEKGVVSAIYNIYSNEINILDEKILWFVGNSNYFIAESSGETYIANLTKYLKVEPMLKIENNKELDIRNAVANSDGSSIFIMEASFNATEGAGAELKKLDYYYVDLKK